MDDGSLSFDPPNPSVESSGESQNRRGSYRLPLEYSLALDVICTRLSADDQVYVGTKSASLLQGVLNRHDRIIAYESILNDLISCGDHSVIPIEETDELADLLVDHILVLDPGSISLIERILDSTPASEHDCIVGNPYSFNRIEDRAVANWLSPRRVQATYESAGLSTDIVGYHGPRSIFASLLGRAWQALNRPDKRDVYTHRMRDAYQEHARPFALLSCLVHITATSDGVRI